MVEPGWGLKDFRQESGGVGDDVPVDQPERACGIVRVEGELDHGWLLVSGKYEAV